MTKTNPIVHNVVFAGAYLHWRQVQKRMRAVGVSIMRHRGMSTGAREREIAISNVCTHVEVDRLDCHVVLHPSQLGSSIFSKVASIATKLFRAAYLYESWSEKTDLHLFLSLSHYLFLFDTKSSALFLPSWKCVAEPRCTLPSARFSSLSRIAADMAGRDGKSYLARRIVHLDPFQSRGRRNVFGTTLKQDTFLRRFSLL